MRVPYTNFKTRIGDTDAVGGCTFIGGEWKDIDTTEIFEGKKVVVFALPGAFTPTCSSQQLPGYEEKYDEIKSLGIDEVYCLSVNDAFVMNAWFRDEKIVKVKPIGDYVTLSIHNNLVFKKFCCRVMPYSNEKSIQVQRGF